jgi:hypothetical protein
VSLLLALLGAASADGAWCALVDLPPINVEAALEYGIEPGRLVAIPAAGGDWTTVVGALLDAFDIVVIRPPARLAPGDGQRLAARTRLRDAVLVPFLTGSAGWPGAAIRLGVQDGQWSGSVDGHRRLRRRQVTVTAERHGQGAPSTSTTLWLPAAGGGVAAYEPMAAVIELPVRAETRGIPGIPGIPSIPSIPRIPA